MLRSSLFRSLLRSPASALVASLCLGATLMGCPDDTSDDDAGEPAVSEPDGGDGGEPETSEPDAGVDDDGGQPPTDAGQEPEPTDAGADDAGSVDDDAGTGDTDGGTPDDGGVTFNKAALTLFLQSAGNVPAYGAVATVQGVEHDVVDGVLVLEDLDAGTTVVHVAADGFVPAAMPVELTEGRHGHLTLSLLPVAFTTTFNAAAGARLTYENAQLEVPSDAFVDGQGNVVTGDIEAHITPFDLLHSPVDFPGSLDADDSDGGEGQLNSFAMADFTFTQNGEELQLADGVTAQVVFGIEEGRVHVGANSAPVANGDMIPAWSYDMTTGRWVHEGVGEVRLSRYGTLEWVFDVTHFSWWNSDENLRGGSDLTCVIVRLEYTDGNPVDEYQVVARGRDWAGQRTVAANLVEGKCLQVPINSEMVFYAGQDHPANFQEYTTGDDLYDCGEADTFGCETTIVMTMPPPTCLRGQVLVDDVPRADVLVTGHANGRQVQATTGSNGDYCLPVPTDSQVRITASLLDDDGRFNEAEATVTTGSTLAMCGGTDCTLAPDLHLSEEDVYCVSGVITDGTDPLPQGWAFHVFGDDFTPTRAMGNMPPQQWQADYVGGGMVGPLGAYCIDLPVESGSFELVVDTVNSLGDVCGGETNSPICNGNSEVITGAESTDFAGRRCHTDPSSCKNVDLVYDQD